MTPQQMFYYLQQQHGLSPDHAAAMLGNFQQESGFNPEAYNAKEDAYGFGQWRGDRLANLRNQYGNNPTPQQQLDFAMWEMTQGPESAAGRRFLAATDVNSAASAFDKYYERSSGEHVGNRVRNARRILGAGPEELGIPTEVSTASRDFYNSRMDAASMFLGSAKRTKEDLRFMQNMAAETLMPYETAEAERLMQQQQQEEAAQEQHQQYIDLPIDYTDMGDQQLMGGGGADGMGGAEGDDMLRMVEQAALGFSPELGASIGALPYDMGTAEQQAAQAAPEQVAIPTQAEHMSAMNRPPADGSQPQQRPNWWERNRANMAVIGAGLSSMSDPAPADISGALKRFYGAEAERKAASSGLPPGMDGTAIERAAAQIMKERNVPYEQAIQESIALYNPGKPTAPKAPTKLTYEVARATSELQAEGIDNPTQAQIGTRLAENSNKASAPVDPTGIDADTPEEYLAQAIVAEQLAKWDEAGHTPTPAEIAEVRREAVTTAMTEGGTNQQRLLADVQESFPTLDAGAQYEIAGMWADPQRAATPRGRERLAESLLTNPVIADQFDKETLMALPPQTLMEMSKNVQQPAMLDEIKQQGETAREQAKADSLANLYADNDAEIAKAYAQGGVEYGDEVRQRKWEEGDRARTRQEEREFNSTLSRMLPEGEAQDALLAATTPAQRKEVLDTYSDQVKQPTSFEEYKLATQDPGYAAWYADKLRSQATNLSPRDKAVSDVFTDTMSTWAEDRNKRDKFSQSLTAAREILLTEGYEGGPVTGNIVVPLQRLADDVLGKNTIKLVEGDTASLHRLLDALRGTEFQTMRETGSGATSDMESTQLLKGLPAGTDEQLAALATTQYQLKLAGHRNREHDLRMEFVMQNPDKYYDQGAMNEYVNERLGEVRVFEKADTPADLQKLIDTGKVKYGDVINIADPSKKDGRMLWIYDEQPEG